MAAPGGKLKPYSTASIGVTRDIGAVQVRAALHVDIEPIAAGVDARLLVDPGIAAVRVAVTRAEARRPSALTDAEAAAAALLMRRALTRILHARNVQNTQPRHARRCRNGLSPDAPGTCIPVFSDAPDCPQFFAPTRVLT